MYVMLTQKLSKGFKSWKAMAEANAEKIKGFKGKVLYAGAHAEDDNSMVVIMHYESCLLYTSPSPRDMRRSRMPSSA